MADDTDLTAQQLGEVLDRGEPVDLVAVPAGHIHAWGHWSKTMPQYDSLGNRLLWGHGLPADAQLTLSGTPGVRPVTPGWTRSCWCGAVEESDAAACPTPGRWTRQTPNASPRR